MEPARIEQYDDEKAASDLRDRLSEFVGKLQAEAKRRVEARATIEQRWLDDLRQYHGKYDANTLKRINENESSAVFLNLTRPKTNAMISRLWDLLFPTDDRNWAIGPTPVPELTEDAERALQLVEDANDTFEAKEQELRAAEEAGNEELAQSLAAEMQETEEVLSAAQKAADDLQDILTEAKRRATLMQEEIDDQFKECGYAAECRDIIRDGCKIGIGVLKGPVLGERLKRRWKATEGTDQDGNVIQMHELTEVPNNAPAAYRVDPWGFFPDPDCKRIEDGDGIYERHLMNKRLLRRFARQAKVDQDAIRRLLKADPDQGNNPSYLVDLNDITEQKHSSVKDTYHVWEFTGALEFEDLLTLVEALNDDDTLADLGEDLDPLDEIHVKIWFCQGEVLKFALHQLDSNDVVYSVFSLEEDENSPFGFGLPYLMRDPQAVLNAAQRMMMDNMGLSTGPQIVVNDKIIEPVDGDWKLKPRKVWRIKNSENPADHAFRTYNIDAHQAELANVIELARRAIDEETSMPQIAQGEQGSGVTKTAQGMALLMNSANVIFRGSVKNFDDNVTVPMLQRFYDWNMQFNPKDEIKGDYEVDARGSSVLMVREMMAQNLIMIANLFGDHPVYGEWLKHSDLMRAIFRAHMIPADEITKTEREYKADMKAKEGQIDPMMAIEQMKAEEKEKDRELEREKIDAQIQVANLEAEVRRYVADTNYDALMNRLAEELNMDRDALDAKLSEQRENREAKERALAVEAAMKERTGDSAGGSI